MKRLAILCALVLSVALLSGCMTPEIVSPSDERLQTQFKHDWKQSMDEAAEDWAEGFETAWDEWSAAWDEARDSRDNDGTEKDHYWKVLDAEGQEVGTVTDPEQVEAIDGLLNDDGDVEDRLVDAPGDPVYSYVYCQRETLKAGQDPDSREYQELVRFTVSESKDVVTLAILEDLPTLLNVDLGDILTFHMAVPAGTAEALRDPGRFLE